MRNILILTLFTLTINCCSGQDYSIESKHFDCMVKTSSELGVDLRKELSEFEEHLIEAGVLADKSGESYYKIYEIIKETGDINFAFQYSLLDSIKADINRDNIDFNEFSTDCIKLAEKTYKTKKYKQSKIYQLKVGTDSIRNSGSIDPSGIASMILSVLSPKDFEHDYYKMTVLLLLATTQDVDSGIMRNLPPIPETKGIEPIDKRNLLTVYVSTDNDSVLVNDKKESIEDLTGIVEKYIKSDSTDTSMPELIPINIDLIGDCFQSKLIIFLQNDRGTSYSTYIKVQNKVTDAYRNIRNTKAIEYFNIEYDRLTIEQQAAIKKLIPNKICEAEPTR